MYKTWTKVDACFSVKKTPLTLKKWIFDQYMSQILYQKKLHNFFKKTNMAKIMINVQKSLKGASVDADFWHGKTIDHALNSEFHWGFLPGENWLENLKNRTFC